MDTLASLRQKDLADHFGITAAAVSKWFKKGRIPAGRVLEIEATFGASKHDLRPDIFGPRPSADTAYREVAQA